MSTDLKNATSAVPGSKIPPTQLTTSEATFYNPTDGGVHKVYVTNVTGSGVTANVSLVKSGGSASVSNRILARSLSAGETVRLDVNMDSGDFLSGLAGAGASISVVVTGTVFTSASVGTPAGIFLDAMSDRLGRGVGSPRTTAITVGNGANRYLLAFVTVGHVSTVDTTTGTFGYDTLTVSSSLSGALTRQISAWFGSSATSVSGTVHIFAAAAPVSGAHTLTATAIKSGLTIDTMQVVGESWSGVTSLSDATAFNVTAAGALAATLTSAVGKRAVLAAGFGTRAPSDLSQQMRHLNGPTTDLFGNVDWLALMDAPGASTVAFTSSDSQYNTSAGINLVA